MEVGGCHSAQKITDEGEVRAFGSGMLDYIVIFVYLHSQFQLLGIVLGRCFQQSQHHILQISFQSVLQS